jgi:hypothetical protein
LAGAGRCQKAALNRALKYQSQVGRSVFSGAEFQVTGLTRSGSEWEKGRRPERIFRETGH